MTALIQDPSLWNERNPFSNVTLERDGARQGDLERKGDRGKGNEEERVEKWEKMERIFQRKTRKKEEQTDEQIKRI